MNVPTLLPSLSPPPRTSPYTRWILLSAVICGCVAADSEPASTFADSNAVHVLTDRSAECPDCMRFERIAVLGDATGSGYVVHTEHLVRDSAGNYWAGQYRDMIKVFDAGGRFLRQVGRAGSGPGEFRTPMPIYTDRAGRVHVLDAGQGRETIFRPDFELDTVIGFPRQLWETAPLPGQAGYAANGQYLRDAEGIGIPLHVTSGSDIIRSFGQPSAADAPAYRLQRVLATDHVGRIYAAWPFEYSITVWTSEGRRITGLRGPSIYLRDPQSGGFSRHEPPISKVIALDADRAGRLWVLTWHASDNWRDHMREQRRPDGQTVLRPIDGDVSKIYTSRLDVIDLTTRAIVAQAERAANLIAFVGDALLLENRSLDDGTPQLVIWQVGLDLTGR